MVLGVEIELTVAASLFRRRIEVYKHDGYLSSSSILVVIKQAHLATDSLISERIGLVIVAVVILIYTTKGFLNLLNYTIGNRKRSATTQYKFRES